MSNQRTRANRASAVTNSCDERLLPEHLEMARPVEDEDDVAGAVADHLVREVDIAVRA